MLNRTERLSLVAVSRWLGTLVLLASVVSVAWLLAACTCTTTVADITHAESVRFVEYQRKTYAQLRARRNFQTPDPDAELEWNGPGEWRPAASGAGTRPEKGILLVHGLGDSPWSFHDLAQELAARGFLVRTVLLPGHGTRPEALLDVSLEQWRGVVQAQAAAMQQDVAGQIYLGGFSTGANLVLEVAYANPDIAGLVLFSPTNPLYGAQGSIRLCWNGQNENVMRACEQGEPVWYSAWGYRENGKVHARLTFNPYFDWQTSVMIDVLNARKELTNYPAISAQ